jgi:hypothetical protein
MVNASDKSKRLAYKLVDQDGYTRKGSQGETLWLPVGSKVRPTGEGDQPCGPGVLHAYISPEVAVLMNPIHGDIPNPRMFKVISDVKWKTDGVKRWTQGECTVLAKVEVPKISLEEKVAFALCVAPHESTREFAVKWLSGKDRSYESARAAMRTAMRAAREAMRAAREAAETGTWVTWTMARAAANAAYTAEVAARWATPTAWVAWAAAKAVETAAALAAAVTREASREAVDKEQFEAKLPQIWERAEAILRGEYPAEQYDAPYKGE